MRQFLDSLDSITIKILFGIMMAIGGGAVRVCGNPQHQQARTIISSMMIVILAGYITATLFHERITDTHNFGVICALGGYSGQLVLVIASKNFEKLIRRFKWLS